MKRALIVDDDSQILSIAQRWLWAAGYEVVTFNDFNDAQVPIRLGEPELVVLDVRLGEFNGIQLGILAREARSDVRVVLMSSWDDPMVRRHAAQLGGRFIHKPFRAADLLNAVRGDSAAS